MEETLLIFDPENIEAVAERFNDKNNMLSLYYVIDPETSGIDLKASRRQVFPATKDISEIIDTHLEKVATYSGFKRSVQAKSPST